MGDPSRVEHGGKGREEEAPFPLTDVDKWVLSQKDEDFHLHDWDELREIIGELLAGFASLFYSSFSPVFLLWNRA